MLAWWKLKVAQFQKNKFVRTFSDRHMSQAQKQPTLSDFLTKMRTMAMHSSKSKS
jgi:hypothetical protein